MVSSNARHTGTASTVHVVRRVGSVIKASKRKAIWCVRCEKLFGSGRFRLLAGGGYEHAKPKMCRPPSKKGVMVNPAQPSLKARGPQYPPGANRGGS